MLLNFIIAFVFALVGGILGAIFSLLFFRMDEGWKKVGTFILGAGSSGGAYDFLNKICGVEEKGMRISMLAIFLLAVVVMAVIAFKILCGLLKNQDGRNIIRVLDIVLGQKNFIQNYYDMRTREIDASLNVEFLENEKERLEAKENSLQNYEAELDRREEDLNKQMQKGIFMNLPEKQKVPLTKELFVEFPEYVESYAKFYTDVNIHTQDIIKELNIGNLTIHQKKIVLEGYFLGICTYIIADIFQANGNNKVRAHFRTLNKEENYVKLVATTGIQASPKDLTPISVKQANMITQSYKSRTSLIKSLNVRYHYTTTNEKVWKEYLTYTFDGILCNGQPFLSFGISVKNKEHFENLLYFLNFCKIEYILQDSIDKIAKECDIINIIARG